MQRKLASLQRVRELLPIENADAIELARINGWQCVVKKGEFALGQLGVFFEIDAIPPDQPVYAFLWKGEAQRPPKFRIRTMRLRGVLSQGLLLPCASLGVAGGEEGDDLTEALDVGRWEPPAPAGMGDWRGPFPAWVPKTDEIRVQSVPEVLDELRGLPYVMTEKIDGTSATYVLDPHDGGLHACSRNQSIAEGESLYWDMVRRYPIEAFLRAHPSLALQGEIAGPGIQKNPLGLSERRFFAFSLYDSASGDYLGHEATWALLAEAGIPTVPVIEEDAAFDETVESLLAKADGTYAGTKTPREGVVVRPRTERRSTALGGRLSFKAISNRYLLANPDRG